MALYWGYRLCSWAVGVAPLGVSYTVARLAGVLVFALWRGGRRRCIRNMLHVSGGNAALARSYARRSFAYYAMYLVDFLRFGALDSAELTRRVDFDGWAGVEQERTGDGIVFVTMHFGMWDFAGATLAQRGVPVTGIADTFANARLNALVVGERERLGMHIVPVERAASGIMRALRRNRVVGLLIDVPIVDGGVEVEFFGDTIAVSDGPARLALRTGAPILTALLPRMGPTSEHFRGAVERVAFTPTGDRDEDARAFTQATMRSLERTVRQHPEQWYMFRNLWVVDHAREEAA